MMRNQCCKLSAFKLFAMKFGPRKLKSMSGAVCTLQVSLYDVSYAGTEDLCAMLNMNKRLKQDVKGANDVL